MGELSANRQIVSSDIFSMLTGTGKFFGLDQRRVELDNSRQFADNSGMKTETAIKHFGSREALAAALGVSRTATYWSNGHVPEHHQYKLQVITAGRLVADAPVRKQMVTE